MKIRMPSKAALENFAWFCGSVAIGIVVQMIGASGAWAAGGGLGDYGLGVIGKFNPTGLMEAFMGGAGAIGGGVSTYKLWHGLQDGGGLRDNMGSVMGAGISSVMLSAAVYMEYLKATGAN